LQAAAVHLQPITTKEKIMERHKTALVIGATGGIGGAIATALLQHGWQVRGLTRTVATARHPRGAEMQWIEGDAMARAEVVEAAMGASIIVHAVNPPRYMNWEKLVLPMMDNTIAAARATGARILLPGTIYNFDPAKTPVIHGDTPQRPKTRKGAIRVALEQRLEQAAPEVSSLILRAGDFFGPCARSSWWAQAMVSPGKPLRRIINPARGGGHSWAYLPDLAQAFARLAEKANQLQPFERLQFQGFHDANGTGMIEAIRRASGRRLPVWQFPWWLIRLAAPFGGFPREVIEIAPYWRHPVRLDNSRLVAVIGDEPHTSLDRAVPATLADLGCLDRPEQASLAITA
jgi:nucleoside-diphosphate-sugar epimerase